MGTKTRVGLVIVAVAVLAGMFYGAYSLGHKTAPQTSAQQADAHPLLARRVFSNSPNDPLINFTSLRNDLQGYFKENNLTGSLYFEYLPTGTQVRVTGDEKQAAASLLKTPLAMEVLKATEQGKISLDQKVTLTPDMLDSAYGQLYQKGAGYTLTVDELLKIMLTDSDNTALKALVSTVDGMVPLDEGVFSYVDAEISQEQDQSVIISARSYGSILKCLYFSCYLKPADSEKILSYLTQTSFNDRLMAGIEDKSITVAHKIGVFQETTQSDCGIVYMPSRPYLLCVMIDGQDDASTNTHIAAMSKKAYDYVKNK